MEYLKNSEMIEEALGVLDPIGYNAILQSRIEALEKEIVRLMDHNSFLEIWCRRRGDDMELYQEILDSHQISVKEYIDKKYPDRDLPF